MPARPLHQRVWTLWSEAAAHATAALRALDRLETSEDRKHPLDQVTSELVGFRPEAVEPLLDMVRAEPTHEGRIRRLTAEALRLAAIRDGLWSAYRAALGKRPDVPVVPLREAAEVLGVKVRAAEDALRRAQIRSGYPLDAVEWLRDNRPGRGARIDLHEKTEA